ncbi:MAG: type II toxin-antitoxin system VapC family toxin [Acidobacteriota bacterium]|nr:MAG: type II toxin-antitoxin system VapC family toxin [Acidobacteriota bacterium]
MSDLILDASAVLAFLNNENGADVVERLIPDAKISSVNVAEVITRSLDLGHTLESAHKAFSMLGLEVISFDERQAIKAAELRTVTRVQGLSLGDRSCLSCAIVRNATAVTADRQWTKFDLCPIELIR